VGSIYGNILKLLDSNKNLIESKRPHITKNSAGYYPWNVIRRDEKSGQDMVDLTQLIVGSQGTLGITVGSKLRLVKTQNEAAMLVVYLYDIAHLADIVDETIKFDPETIETYDDKTIMLAVKFWQGFIKMKGFFGFIKMGISFIPEFFMMFRGMPKMVLLIECTGDDPKEVLSRVELLNKRLDSFKSISKKVIRTKEDGEKYWTIRHDSFKLLREHTKGKRTAPFVDDVIVPPGKLPEFIPAMRKILDSYKLDYSIAGHAGNGNFHIIPFIGLDESKSLDMILDVSNKVYALVVKMGGSITAEHNDGIIRTPYLVDMYGVEMVKLFADIKKIFDPQDILNPGKKVGLTKADIGKYLITK
jgi:FAD/FMN-containing dehydrogenase